MLSPKASNRCYPKQGSWQSETGSLQSSTKTRIPSVALGFEAWVKDLRTENKQVFSDLFLSVFTPLVLLWLPYSFIVAAD